MKGFQSPNYTQVPNDLFDIHMRDMENSELKVTLAIVRQTIGYHRDEVKFSIPKLMEMTGLSRNAVKAGAEAAEKRGTLERLNPNEQGSAEWGLVVDPLNEKPLPPQPLTPTPSIIEGQVRLKESNKETKKKGDLVDGFIELSQMPGVKKQIRLEGIQSRIAVALNINVTWSRWERFIRYADKQEQDHGQAVEGFMDWLKAKPNFDITYWPPDKMQEVWPQAFTEIKNWTPIPDVEKTQAIIEQKEKKFVPPPAGLRPRISQPQPKGI